MATGVNNSNTGLNNFSLPEMREAKLSLRETALKIALSYEGQEEVPRGSNAGPFVEACLKLVGLGKGFSWCAAYTYRCFHEAAKELGVNNPCAKTAGVLDRWNKTPANRRVTKANARNTNILPGYEFVYNHGKGLGHIGIVVKMNADGSFITIEGNTDKNGGREGVGVYKRTRRLTDAHLQGFIVY